LTGAARTQAPTITNYDVDSTTWADLRRAPLLSAMEATSLGHGPSWSPIDPVQVSMFEWRSLLLFYSRTTSPFHCCFPCGTDSSNRVEAALDFLARMFCPVRQIISWLIWEYKTKVKQILCCTYLWKQFYNGQVLKEFIYTWLILYLNHMNHLKS
jgi:hypothetical protein